MAKNDADVKLKSLADFFHRNLTIILVLTIIVLMIHAFHEKQTLVDDAFISFRYAKNLVEGNGLVWNPGERVEGYTNFLWTILFSLGLKLGLKVETITLILAIPIHLICLILTFLLAMKVLKSRSLAFIALLLVGFNHSISAFAPSGMETPLYLCEHLLAAYLFFLGLENGWKPGRLIMLSVVLCLTLMTRPDAVILIAVSYTHLTLPTN